MDELENMVAVGDRLGKKLAFVRFYNVTDLKANHYVKEFGEGLDRICRELKANGANVPTFSADDFILKITER